MAGRRPFHKTLAEAIRTTNTGEGLNLLGWFILETIIPKGHDEIVSAIRESIPGADNDDSLWGAVVADVLEQKREAEAEAKELAERDEAMLRDQVRREERLLMDDLHER